MPKHSESKPGLVPDRLVAERYDVTVRTLERWDATPGLEFPKPVYIRRRRFREVSELDRWDAANARRVANPPSPSRAVAQALPRAQRGRFIKAEQEIPEQAPSRFVAGAGGRTQSDKARPARWFRVRSEPTSAGPRGELICSLTQP